MSINLVTYLKQLIKKIHYIIIVIIILSSLQFFYQKYRVYKGELTIKINMYPVKVMYWTVSNKRLVGEIDNQVLNLLYEIEKTVAMNKEYKSLEGTECTIKEIILSCKKKGIPDEDVEDVKKFMKVIINHKFNRFFDKEVLFIDKKIASLELSLEKLEARAYTEKRKSVESKYIEGSRYFILEKNYLAKLELETRIFDLYFLKESFNTVKDLLILTDKNIEITKASTFINYPMIILSGFLIGMLIIFLSMIEQKPED